MAQSGDMDKTNNIKIDPAQRAAQNDAMSEETADALFSHAADLAYDAFADTTDDHIEGVFARLVLNHAWGLGDEGAVTVH